MSKLDEGHAVGFIFRRETSNTIAGWKPLVDRSIVKSKNLFRKNLYAHYGCVNAVEFSCDGDLLISGGDDRRILLWKVDKSIHGKDEPAVMIAEHSSNVFALAMDHANRKIFSAGNDDQVIVHDVATGVPLDYFVHEQPVYGVSIDPLNDNIFSSACDDGRLYIYDTRESSNADPFCLASVTSAFHAVMFHPSEPRLIVSGNSKEGVALWDVRKPRTPLLRYGGLNADQCCMSARFNSDGSQILALRRRLPPVLYSTQETAHLFQFNHTGYYNSCTMKSCCFAGTNDQFVLSGSDNFDLYMWKIPPAGADRWVDEAHLVLRGHRSIVNQVRYNRAHSVIISSGVEKLIKVWSPFAMTAAGRKFGVSSMFNMHEKERRIFSHTEYINLVTRSGQFMSLTYDNTRKTTREDPRMMAFFDALVQRDIEGWSDDSDNIAENSYAVISPPETSSSEESNYEDSVLPPSQSSQLLDRSSIGNGNGNGHHNHSHTHNHNHQPALNQIQQRISVTIHDQPNSNLQPVNTNSNHNRRLGDDNDNDNEESADSLPSFQEGALILSQSSAYSSNDVPDYPRQSTQDSERNPNQISNRRNRNRNYRNRRRNRGHRHGHGHGHGNGNGRSPNQETTDDNENPNDDDDVNVSANVNAHDHDEEDGDDDDDTDDDDDDDDDDDNSRTNDPFKVNANRNPHSDTSRISHVDANIIKELISKKHDRLRQLAKAHVVLETNLKKTARKRRKLYSSSSSSSSSDHSDDERRRSLQRPVEGQNHGHDHDQGQNSSQIVSESRYRNQNGNNNNVQNPNQSQTQSPIQASVCKKIRITTSDDGESAFIPSDSSGLLLACGSGVINHNHSNITSESGAGVSSNSSFNAHVSSTNSNNYYSSISSKPPVAGSSSGLNNNSYNNYSSAYSNSNGSGHENRLVEGDRGSSNLDLQLELSSQTRNSYSEIPTRRSSSGFGYGFVPGTSSSTSTGTGNGNGDRNGNDTGTMSHHLAKLSKSKIHKNSNPALKLKRDQLLRRRQFAKFKRLRYEHQGLGDSRLPLSSSSASASLSLNGHHPLPTSKIICSYHCQAQGRYAHPGDSSSSASDTESQSDACLNPNPVNAAVAPAPPVPPSSTRSSSKPEPVNLSRSRNVNVKVRARVRDSPDPDSSSSSATSSSTGTGSHSDSRSRSRTRSRRSGSQSPSGSSTSATRSRSRSRSRCHRRRRTSKLSSSSTSTSGSGTGSGTGTDSDGSSDSGSTTTTSTIRHRLKSIRPKPCSSPNLVPKARPSTSSSSSSSSSSNDADNDIEILSKLKAKVQRYRQCDHPINEPNVDVDVDLNADGHENQSQDENQNQNQNRSQSEVMIERMKNAAAFKLSPLIRRIETERLRNIRLHERRIASSSKKTKMNLGDGDTINSNTALGSESYSQNHGAGGDETHSKSDSEAHLDVETDDADLDLDLDPDPDLDLEVDTRNSSFADSGIDIGNTGHDGNLSTKTTSILMSDGNQSPENSPTNTETEQQVELPKSKELIKTLGVKETGEESSGSDKIELDVELEANPATNIFSSSSGAGTDTNISCWNRNEEESERVQKPKSRFPANSLIQDQNQSQKARETNGDYV